VTAPSKKSSSRGSATGAAAGDVLSLRVLNRTLLRRQLLLDRVAIPVEQAVEHLVAMQAQAPDPPYLGLWTRLHPFALKDLSDAIMQRRVVRIALHRNTIHLVTAADCLSFRPVLQPMMEMSMRTAFVPRLAGADLDELAAFGRELVEAEPMTFSALSKALAERWPDADPFALSQSVRQLVPLVQVPPRGVWGSSGQATHTSAEVWLGKPLATETDPDEMVLRYLAAFGPASVKDAQVWCGLTRLNEVVKRQGDRLRHYRDENGVQLLDLADGELATGDEDAPVRLLPDFDNILLSHADRSRIMPDAYKGLVFTSNGLIRATVLLDGFVVARWRIDRAKKDGKKEAVLLVEPFKPLAKAKQAKIAAEANRLLRFAAKDADIRDVRFTDPL
jgi:Winged helix DNA-binding domain